MNADQRYDIFVAELCKRLKMTLKIIELPHSSRRSIEWVPYIKCADEKFKRVADRQKLEEISEKKDIP